MASRLAGKRAGELTSVGTCCMGLHAGDGPWKVNREGDAGTARVKVEIDQSPSRPGDPESRPEIMVSSQVPKTRTNRITKVHRGRHRASQPRSGPKGLDRGWPRFLGMRVACWEGMVPDRLSGCAVVIHPYA